MQIKPIGDKPTRGVKGKNKLKHTADGKFHDLLAKSDQTGEQERTQSLFESIETAANELVESRSNSALKEYRKRIREFLTEVLDSSREVKVIVRDSVYEEPYVIVKVVDTKLDELAALVIKEEMERGELMRLIDEIKGILVDLYK
ncbi:YaaR family protein [bacterium]|nr:YaaR family protein [bacterium]